jgi:hypothetical protein
MHVALVSSLLYNNLVSNMSPLEEHHRHQARVRDVIKVYDRGHSGALDELTIHSCIYCFS